jgi:ubiquinone/menaquinone biosynthesis C-methylase UbiE
MQDSHRHKLTAPSSAKRQDLVNAYFQDTAAYWKEFYDREDVDGKIYQQRQDVVLALVDKLGLPVTAPVLEVGCGPGLTSVALAQRGYRVRAVDSVDTMIDLTRQLAAEAGVKRRVIASVGDVQHLPFRDSLFHLLLALGLTEWVYPLYEPMQEMVRVLKPGGYLIVNADNRWSLYRLLDPWRNPAFEPVRRRVSTVLRRPGHNHQALSQTQSYSIKDFDSLLSGAGLENVENMTLGFGPLTFLGHKWLPDSISRTLHRKAQTAADRGFPGLRSRGRTYIVLARKAGRDNLRPKFETRNSYETVSRLDPS